MWLSLFPVRGGTTGRQPGLYGAAFVDYREGGVLTYRELLVARLMREGVAPRVRITDIWVDSETSRDGGRSLWSIPKDLADLHLDEQPVGPAVRTSCDANIGGSAVAAARFTAVRLPSLRTPVGLTVSQEPLDGRGTAPVLTAVSGSSRNAPVLGRWDFGADGPLAWLHGHQPVASFRLADFRLSFGG